MSLSVSQPPGFRPVLAHRAAACPLRFGGAPHTEGPDRRDPQRALLRTAPFSPEARQTLAQAGLSEATARMLLGKAYEEANRSRALPNVRPGYAFGASALATLPATGPGLPPETVVVSDRNLPNRQDNFFCAERATLKQVENHGIGTGRPGAFRQPRVQALALVNAVFNAPDILNASPCLFCLQAFQTSHGLMDEHTTLLTLRHDLQGGLSIDARPLRAYLPMMGRQHPSYYAEGPIDTLPVTFSEAAQRVMASMNQEITPQRVYETLNAAKIAHDDALTYNRSARNGLTSGAALLIHTPDGTHHIASGSDLRPKNAYFTPCDMDAASDALRPLPLPRWRRRLTEMIQTIQSGLGVLQSLSLSHRVPGLSAMATRLHHSLTRLAQAIAPPIAPGGKPLKGLALVAYYSPTVSDLPRPESFGALSQLAGSQAFLAAVIEPEDGTGRPCIQVRAFSDYLPILYLKRNHLGDRS